MQDRTDGQIDGLKETHPNFEIVATGNPKDNSTAMDETENILTAHPETEAIFNWGDSMALGTLEVCLLYTSFCTMDSRERGDMVRTVTRSEFSQEGDMVTFSVAADGFLYNMVRIMVGTLLYVAQGKIPPEAIPEILQAKDRNCAGPTAPPQGLYLNRVFYEGCE